MEELKVFNNDEFGEIRISEKDGNVWFCLADVCRVLELSQPSKVKDRLNLNGVNTIPTIDIMGRNQNTLFINESNLYKTIFQSRKSNAEKFTDWVTEEVLPSIRNNGGYIANQEQMTPEQIVANALVVAQNIIEKQNKKLKEQEPLVKFAEHVSESTNSISIGDFAKIVADENIKVGRNRMFDWLKNNGYIMKGNNIPYQKYIDNNMFEVIEQVFNTPYGTKTGTKTLITGKGQIHVMEKLRDEFGEV